MPKTCGIPSWTHKSSPGPSNRLRSQSLRLLVTVVRGSAAATQQAAGAKAPAAAVSSGKALPRQATASKQQQHAKVTLHKNRRSKHSMPVPSEPVVQQMPVSPFASCRALVLDSSYRPIDVINWQRALILDLFEKVRERSSSSITRRWLALAQPSVAGIALTLQ